MANTPTVGSVVGPAVGVSLGVSLLAVAGVFFFLRRRRARARAPPRIAAAESDVNRRCAELENQVFILQEQGTRLEAQQVRFAGGSGILYMHEKDAEALDKGDTKSMKEAPPTYGG